MIEKPGLTRDEAVAYHEAGHAIVGLRLGATIREVTIRDDAGSMGRVSMVFPDGDDVLGDTAIWCVYALAGMTAEVELLGLDDPEASTTDMAGARRDALFSIGIPPDSPEAEHPLVQAEAMAVIEEAAYRAARIITDNAGAVHRLAAALREHGLLDGEQVHAMITESEVQA